MNTKIKSALRGIFCAAIAMTAMSCASVSTMQTPGVVPKGEVRWAISSSAAGADGNTVISKDDNGVETKLRASADPNLEAMVRYGAAENFDIGLKLNFLGAQVGAKYQFVRGEFDLALGIEAGYQWVRTSGTDSPSTHLLQLQIPILMEYHFNPYVGLAFGPKFLGLVVLDTETRNDVWGSSGLYTGIMLGLPLRLTDGIWFMPEINVYANAYDENENSFTHALWQASISVFFGGL